MTEDTGEEDAINIAVRRSPFHSLVSALFFQECVQWPDVFWKASGMLHRRCKGERGGFEKLIPITISGNDNDGEKHQGEAIYD